MGQYRSMERLQNMSTGETPGVSRHQDNVKGHHQMMAENKADILSPMARKTLEGKTRTVRVFIRLYPEEKQRFIALCDKAGFSQADFFRKHMLKVKTTRRTKAAQLNEGHLLSLLGQIGGIGNNINQIARHLNRGDLVETREIRESLLALGHLQKQIKTILNPVNDNDNHREV